jgi:hypothetical protein
MGERGGPDYPRIRTSERETAWYRWHIKSLLRVFSKQKYSTQQYIIIIIIIIIINNNNIL